MPYTQMIPILRRLLQQLNSEAADLERRWNHQRNPGANPDKQGPSNGNQQNYNDAPKPPRLAARSKSTQESTRSTSTSHMKKRSNALPEVEVPKG